MASSPPSLLKLIVPALVVIFALLLFRTEISRAISTGPDDDVEATIGPGGFTISRKAKSASLATEKIVLKGIEVGRTPVEIAEMVERVVAAASDKTSPGNRPARILWVDDNPTNNRWLKQSLEAAGIKVVIAKSNKEARRAIRRGKFGAIITDLGRDNESEDGFQLVAGLRRSGATTPIAVYASDEAAKGVADDLRLASAKITADPSVLYAFVFDSLGGGNSSKTAAKSER